MSKYKFIKSTFQMRDELYNLWDNFEVYNFLEGYKWICDKEQNICECLTRYGRDNFIASCRIDYIVKQHSEYR